MYVFLSYNCHSIKHTQILFKKSYKTSELVQSFPYYIYQNGKRTVSIKSHISCDLTNIFSIE